MSEDAHNPTPANPHSWMDDPESLNEFDAIIARLDEKFKPIQDAMRESERITEKDLQLIIR